jgi:RecB family endonuclease NucS
LAKEKSTGNYVVIELKKHQASDKTIGQLARYMGWVKENMAKNGTVKGVIISHISDEKLHYAPQAIPNVELFLYKISFSLSALY